MMIFRKDQINVKKAQFLIKIQISDQELNKSISKKMGGNSMRHLKALCRKNTINWKRTLCGSICEVILPVMLMGFLMWARYEIDIIAVENYSLYSLRHPLYPIARPGGGNTSESQLNQGDVNEFFGQLFENSNFTLPINEPNQTSSDEIDKSMNTSDTFKIDTADQLRQSQDYDEFMKYTRYTNLNQTFEIPVNITEQAERVLPADVAKNVAGVLSGASNSTEQVTEAAVQFTKALEEIKVENITELVDWNALQVLITNLNLSGQVQVDDLRSALKEIELVYANQSETLKDVVDTIDSNLTESVLQAFSTNEEEVIIPISLDRYLPMFDPLGPYFFLPSHCLIKTMNRRQMGQNQSPQPKPPPKRPNSRPGPPPPPPSRLDRRLSAENDWQNSANHERNSAKIMKAFQIMTQSQPNKLRQEQPKENEETRLNKEAISDKQRQEKEKQPEFSTTIDQLQEDQEDPDNFDGNPFIFDSTVVAYIENDSRVQKDMVDQLESLFAIQKQLTSSQQSLQTLSFLSQFVNVNQLANSEEIKGITQSFGLNATDINAASAGLGQFSGIDLTSFNLITVGNFTLVPFKSKQDLDDYIQTESYGQQNKPGICFGFEVKEEQPNKFELELIFSAGQSPFDGKPGQNGPSYVVTATTPDITSYSQYSWGGFGYMQNWVANTILKRITGKRNASILAMTVPTRMPDSERDDFASISRGVLAFFVVVIYILPLYRTVYRMVAEKQTRVRESMYMMGLHEFAYWLSWLIYYTCVNTALVTIIWAILTFYVLHISDSLILYAIFWLYGQCLFGITVLTQALFESPRAAAVCTTIIYFGSTIVYYLVDDPDQPAWQKYLGSLSPNVALYFIIKVLTEFESSLVGSQFYNLHSNFQNVNVANGLIMLIIDGVYLTLLGLYFEAVLPKSHGVRRHPCYFLSLSFWRNQITCCKRSPQNKPSQNVEMKNLAKKSKGQVANFDSQQGVKPVAQAMQTIDMEINGQSLERVEETKQFETKYLNSICYEPVAPQVVSLEEENRILKIEDLHKQYANGFKAVNGVNLKMFQDQIFVLLGHNGAGKTTTISMLTGLLSTSKGKIELFGKDLVENIDECRRDMGVCPQHDVLFDLLTPEEHLDIFYDFKGVQSENKKQEIEKLLADVGIADKKDSLASQLSGGNKRKLSVAIALCGNSKFVLLDEPTAGLDLQARRNLWGMLKEYKKDKIIILTTHYMDEADILGDRIGIMTQGTMTALGSSLFLKNRFGVGYVITLVKETDEKNLHIMPYLKERLGEKIQLQSEIATEMSIQVPKEYASNFIDFFDEFDKDLGKLGFQSYGVSVTTLEQVFLEVGHLKDASVRIKGLNSDQNLNTNPDEISNQDILKNQNPSSSVRQVASIQMSIDQQVDITEQDLVIVEETGQQKEVKVITDRNKEYEEKINFSISESKTDTTFCTNFLAVFSKRLNSYKRNKLAIFNEMILPALFMLIGVLIATNDYYQRSKSKIVQPLDYPENQKIIINQDILGKHDVLSKDLAQNLPQNDLFEISFLKRNEKGLEGIVDFKDFSEQVYQFGKKEADIEPYMYGSYEIFEASREDQQYSFVSYVNTTSKDVVSHYPQFMYESILKVASNDPLFEFKVKSSPPPRTYNDNVGSKANQTGAIIFFAAISFSIVITVTVSYLVVERISMLKHVQVIQGMQLKAYWIANFIFDAIKLYIVVGASMLIFKAFKLEYESSLIVLACFPLGVIPFTYVMSFCFASDSAAQSFTMFLHFCAILIFSSITILMRVAPKIQLTGDILNIVFKLIPSYSIASSLFFEVSGKQLAQVRKLLKDDNAWEIEEDQWHWSNNLLDIYMQFVHFFVWTAILILLESDCCQRKKSFAELCCKRYYPRKVELELDEDVRQEATRIQNETHESMQVHIQNLRKVYMTGSGLCNPGKPLLAVEDVSFGLTKGECFALLGVNGAGKSTTFKALTNEIQATSGTVSVLGHNMKTDFSKVKRFIGYCPQTNPLFDWMSVEEHIDYFARIKGIPSEVRKSVCDQTIKKMDLEEQRKKLAGNLSGGNKRKLSVALAILGSPPVILLDEPSAGMDPEARRFMWNVVAELSQSKASALVLTTHSMEEAEALSTRLGIMVKGGVFKCFGTPQHIRDKFGSGYVIEIKTKAPNAQQTEEIVSEMLNQKITPNGIETEAEQSAENSKDQVPFGQTEDLLSKAGVPHVVSHFILHSLKNSHSWADKTLQKQGSQIMPENVKTKNAGGNIEESKRVEESLKQQNMHTVSKRQLAGEIFEKGALFGVIESLAHKFPKVDIIEAYDNYARLRVDRADKSIGFLFKMVDELKREHQLDDYSVCQTTLEQIFQRFADLKFDEIALSYKLDSEGILILNT